MKRKGGFSVIELLTIIGITGILLGVGGANFIGWRDKQRVFNEADRVRSMVDTAKSNAFAERKCSNGKLSKFWFVRINSTDTENNFRLYCLDEDSVNILEEPIDENNSDYTFDDNYVATAFFHKRWDDVNFTEATDYVDVKFFEDTLQAEVYGGSNRADILRFDFVAVKDGSLIQRMCFNRIGGYLYTSESSDCAEFPEELILEDGPEPDDCTGTPTVGDSCGGGIFAGPNIVAASNTAGAMAWNTAVSQCENYVSGGYSDWHLPDLDELSVLYINRNDIGGFNSGRYWSSSGYIFTAWTIRFGGGWWWSSSGSMIPYIKTLPNYVRCVRNAE